MSIAINDNLTKKGLMILRNFVKEIEVAKVNETLKCA
jgi:hypothetical protein